MKKFFFMALSAALFSSVMSAAAIARDGAYLAIRGGSVNENMNSDDDSAFDDNRLDFDYVWFVSGAVGYRWNYLRAEIEYTYRNDFDDTYSSASGALANEIYSHMVLKSKSVMFNAYFDFMPNYVISPYINAGIGWTYLEMEDTTHTFGNVVKQPSFDETNFTWSLGAGLTIRINKCINIDGGYRYVDMGELEHANINAHEIYGGIRYTF